VITATGDSYLELRVDIPKELVDPVCDFIIEHISNGLVLEEEEDTANTGILFYISPETKEQSKAQLSEYLQGLKLTHANINPTISERTVKSVEWVEQYKQSVTPILISDDVCVRPPWSSAPTDTKFDIIIEPKMAFGTGHHETTRSCLKLIRQHFKPGVRVLDMGCGSGILAILAAQMGASYIKAVDYDPEAVENCQENFVINHITVPNEIVHGSIDVCKGDKQYEFICVNIIKSAIIEMFAELHPLLASGGVMLLSGLLDKDVADISALLEQHGFTDFTILHDNEWRTYTVRKR
jgi:ribosomal protein L11 methyltransferase